MSAERDEVEGGKHPQKPAALDRSQLLEQGDAHLRLGLVAQNQVDRRHDQQQHQVQLDGRRPAQLRRDGRGAERRERRAGVAQPVHAVHEALPFLWVVFRQRRHAYGEHRAPDAQEHSAHDELLPGGRLADEPHGEQQQHEARHEHGSRAYQVRPVSERDAQHRSQNYRHRSHECRHVRRDGDVLFDVGQKRRQDDPNHETGHQVGRLQGQLHPVPHRILPRPRQHGRALVARSQSPPRSPAPNAPSPSLSRCHCSAPSCES